MYATEVDDQVLTLTVSGMLWKRSLVIKDIETGSLWSHILGRCMEGELEGRELEIVPSVITDWKTWKELYPETTVMKMSKTMQNYKNRFIALYPHALSIGIVIAGQPKSYRVSELNNQPLVNDSVADVPLVLWYDSTTGAGWIYLRESGDQQPMTFEIKEGHIVDVETGSTWDLRKGLAIEGELKGTQLEALPAIPTFNKAWAKFHPNSITWPAEEDNSNEDNDNSD